MVSTQCVCNEARQLQKIKKVYAIVVATTANFVALLIYGVGCDSRKVLALELVSSFTAKYNNLQ